MLERKRNPTRSDIRQFSAVLLGGFSVLGMLAWYFGARPAEGWWPDGGEGTGTGMHIAAVVLWVLGVTLFATCRVAPGAGCVIYVWWMTAAGAIGFVVTNVLLIVVFVVALPVFALIRLKDPLRLRMRRSESYWEPPTPHEHTLERMRRPF